MTTDYTHPKLTFDIVAYNLNTKGLTPCCIKDDCDNCDQNEIFGHCECECHCCGQCGERNHNCDCGTVRYIGLVTKINPVRQIKTWWQNLTAGEKALIENYDDGFETVEPIAKETEDSTMTSTEIVSGLDYDHATGNYKATETAASDYSEAWQDDAGQWWVSGDDVAEVLSQVAKEKANEEWDQTWGENVELDLDGVVFTVKTDNPYWNVEDHEGKVQEVDGTYQVEADYYSHFKAESIAEFSEKY